MASKLPTPITAFMTLDVPGPVSDRVKEFTGEAQVFMKQLMEETDRGAALVGVAYLDKLLERLFEGKMRLTKDLSKELFRGFGGRPLNGSRTGGYAEAILTLERTLATMDGLQGDELRRYAEQHCTSKPEVAEAIGKLETLQRQAQQHFRSAYLRPHAPTR